MRRVVVTGIGIVSPLGVGVEHVWRRLLNGESGIERIERFEVSDIPCKIAGIIPYGESEEGSFNPDAHVPKKDQRKMDEFIVCALGAADEAVADAGWAVFGPWRARATRSRSCARCWRHWPLKARW